jgi:aspartyl-tRNA(Asn)/glutamyl-tRNA(Gln) amidotransferase subunit A
LLARLPATMTPFSTIPTIFREPADLVAAFRRRQLSPVELIDELVARIEKLNPAINAYLVTCADTARDAARAAERAIMKRTPLRLLHGVPISVKDIIPTVEAPTTAGSRIFGTGLVTERDAPVVRRLRRAGAIVLGKTNLHEVALGVTSANEHFGAVRNPWNPDLVAGGSSGGSAAAVAAGLGPLSLGSDTRGSIRIPAACCGITGLKPTRGLLPIDDVIPLSPSLDHVGPMARSADGCARMLAAMTARRDASRPGRMIKGLKVGISEFHLRDVDGGMAPSLDGALEELRKLGCQLQSIEIPQLESIQAASVAITSSEAVAYHDAMLRSRPESYGPLVRKRLESGYERTALEYLRALAIRDEASKVYARTFEEVDCLVGAALPAFPPVVGEQYVVIDGARSNVVEAFTRLNSPQNMAGVPALVLPCGFSKAGLPVGLQLIGPHRGDNLLLHLAAGYQRATDWHTRIPPVAASR